MTSRCEKAVHDIFPVARAMIAKRLVDVYKFSQTRSAKYMGISQPAISQYRKNMRGNKKTSFMDDAGFLDVINEIAKGIAEGSIKPEQVDDSMCRICREVQK
ncbi:MAG: hypothetical protein JW789_04525 [Candidatus Aenigmarchaeota archaeon]|nr:hypothetical protein [Candidatus Aenigmarchaeota archaeon]